MRVFPTRDDMIRALAKPGNKICEIGVFLGDFAKVLASTEPSLLYLVDIWTGVCSSGNADGNNVIDAYLPSAYKKVLEWARPLSFVDVVRSPSWEALDLTKMNTFDIIYIDGDHSYEGVKRDLELAYMCIKDGGYICGHDYEMNPVKAKHNYEFGVKRAVSEFCAAKGLEICAKGEDGCVSFAIQVKKCV